METKNQHSPIAQRIFNLIIFDESGSMELIKREAISGFNETVQTIASAQKEHPLQRHFVSLVAFNTDAVRLVYNKVAVMEVPMLDGKIYRPCCGTPLYDAMGTAILSLQRTVSAGDTVLVTVITDGEENASREFKGSQIKQLVEQKRAEGWVFTYIGTNQDVSRVARTLSINNSITFSYSEEGTKEMFERDKACRSRFFDVLATSGIAKNDEYFDEDD